MSFILTLCLFVGYARASTLEEFGLANKSWVDPFTTAFIYDLRSFDRSLSPETMTAIHRLEQIQLNTKDQSYHINIEVREHDGAEVLVNTFYLKTKTKPVGVWVISVREGVTKTVTHEYLKFAPEIFAEQTGVADAAFKLFKLFTSEVGARSDRLEAGWLGRYVWAKKGFRFRSDVMVYENGEALSQLGLARKNFRRFCQANGIAISDLRRSTEASDLRISEDLNELITPFDFAQVVHKDRKKILAVPYVDHERLGTAKTLDIGRAFVVSDYRPSRFQQNTIVVGGLARSDVAMPPWYGIRFRLCDAYLLHQSTDRTSRH